MTRRIPRRPGKATQRPGQVPRSGHGAIPPAQNFDTIYAGGSRFNTVYGGGSRFNTIYAGGSRFDTVYAGVPDKHVNGPVTVRVVHPQTRKVMTVAYNPRTKLYLDEKTKSWKPAPQWMRTQIR
jgi:hypothetical protein